MFERHVCHDHFCALIPFHPAGDSTVFSVLTPRPDLGHDHRYLEIPNRVMLRAVCKASTKFSGTLDLLAVSSEPDTHRGLLSLRIPLHPRRGRGQTKYKLALASSYRDAGWLGAY
jgi:hypothetical protein